MARNRLKQIFIPWTYLGSIRFVKVGSEMEIQGKKLDKGLINSLISSPELGDVEKGNTTYFYRKYKLLRKNGNFIMQPQKVGSLSFSDTRNSSCHLYYEDKSNTFIIDSLRLHSVNPLPDEVLLWVKEIMKELGHQYYASYTKYFKNRKYKIEIPSLDIYEKKLD